MDTSTDWLQVLRPALFCALLILLGAIERARPVRLSDPQRPMRWPANFGLVAIGTAMIIALQMSLIASSLWAQEHNFGLFNHIEAPSYVEWGVAWLLLDLAIYAQHRAFHEIRWLWPLHRVHHSDVEFDVTTGLRFHPGELLLSQLFKMCVIVAIGAPWVAVVAFEVGLSSFAILTHANFRVSGRADRFIRLLFVTPDMHRIHHSVHRDETDSNYGNLLSIWDRVFASYRARPREDQRQMKIGIPEYRAPGQQNLLELLLQPRER